ncbi:GIP, partial [Symbiodinium pilosum]
MTSMAVIVAVLTRYQPGGPSERANVLAFLVSPERPTSIENGLTTCRRWLRQLQRAKELNLMLPDATLLIKGADSLMGPVLTRSQQSVFRLNSFRNERKLDYMPTFDSIVAFGQLILAEYELLQHSENLMDDSTYAFLQSLALTGKLAVQVDGALMFRMVWLYLIAEAVTEEL